MHRREGRRHALHRAARVETDARGVIESDVFPGLRLNVPKTLADDLAAVLAELEAPAD